VKSKRERERERELAVSVPCITYAVALTRRASETAQTRGLPLPSAHRAIVEGSGRVQAGGTLDMEEDINQRTACVT